MGLAFSFTAITASGYPLLQSDSGKKRALALIYSHVFARENFGCSKFWHGSNFPGFNFRSAVGDRKLNPVENNWLYGTYVGSIASDLGCTYMGLALLNREN